MGVVVGSKMIVTTGSGSEELWFNDVYALDLGSFQWHMVEPEGAIPGPRDYVTINCISNKVAMVLCVYMLVCSAVVCCSICSSLEGLVVLMKRRNVTMSFSVWICVEVCHKATVYCHLHYDLYTNFKTLLAGTRSVTQDCHHDMPIQPLCTRTRCSLL